MATSIVSAVDNQSILAPTMKDTPSMATLAQLNSQSDEPAEFDPLATTASVPSSDDGLDDDQTDSTDSKLVGDTSTVTQKNTDFETETTLVESSLATAATTTDVTTDNGDEKQVNTALSEKSDVDPALASFQSLAVSEPKENTTSLPAATSQPQEETEVANVKSFDDEVEKIMATTQAKSVKEVVPEAAAVKNQQQQQPQDEELRRSPSRSLSRQELRRRSSFFNSKDIVTSDRRYSSRSTSSTLSSSSSSSSSYSSYSYSNPISTSVPSSLRPIADPRFKSRFQNILAEWKARADN
ncbi:hypothetical protein BGZ46_001537 [Entomortierella lignicola]|nr:hypothetical protein BGZ46_001537 [Entomortierella lignicola]